MTQATEKQINYIYDLVELQFSQIAKLGREMFKGEFRDFQFSKRTGGKKMGEFSRDEQKAMFAEMKDQLDQDWTEYVEIITARLDSISPAEMAIDEASTTINYLKNLEYGKI